MCSGQSGGSVGSRGEFRPGGPGWLLSLRFMCSLTHTDPWMSCHVPAARPQQEGNGWSLKVRSSKKKQKKKKKKRRSKKKKAANSREAVYCPDSSRTEGILCPMIHAELSAPSGRHGASGSRVRQPPAGTGCCWHRSLQRFRILLLVRALALPLAFGSRKACVRGGARLFFLVPFSFYFFNISVGILFSFTFGT